MVLRKCWYLIKDERILSLTGVFHIMGQQITVISSPISRKLVELTRARSIDSDLQLDRCISSDYHYMKHGDDWVRFLLKPNKVVQYIKRYHCVGNGFFVVISIHITAILYLITKSTFHRFVTGSDKIFAQYYADRYFPRILHTYTDTQYLDSQILSISIILLLFRLSRLSTLVKNSIINRDGYKHITAQQSSFSSALALVLPANDWLRFWSLVRSHRKDCAENNEIKRRHLSFGNNIEDAFSKKNQMELIYFHNPISFEQCYNVLETHCSSDSRVSWAEEWFVPEPVMRLDPFEYGWWVIVTIIGLLLGLMINNCVIITAFIYELCALANDSNEDSCLMQVPSLLSSLSRLIRILDVIVLVILHLPPQIEGATFYWDCCIMISRARKVKEALEGDIDRCSKARSGIGEHNFRAVIKNRSELNRAIWLHIRLIRCVYREFWDLRISHSIYLNILVIGGGFLLSVSVKEITSSDSIFKVSILHSFNMACGVLMGLSVLFCILVENTVSSSRIRMVVIQLDMN